MRVRFRCNGTDADVVTADGESLLSVLRERLGLVSVKDGCAPQGQCGCCTVLVDGEPVLSCLLPVANVAGRSVSTLEGMGGADPLQRAFHERFAVQCGFCAPGMLMAARALLDRNPSPTRDEIAEALVGNVCRCTGYESIIDAIATCAAGPPPSASDREAGHLAEIRRS